MTVTIAQLGRGFGPTGGAGATPATPVIAVEGADTSMTVTINGQAGVTHQVLYKLAGAVNWTVGNTRVGDGDVAIEGPLDAGTYQVIVYSSNAGAISAPSNMVVVVLLGPLGAGDNPLTRIHDALWALLEADASFTTLVKPGNRIKFSGSPRGIIKEQATTGDYPEVRIVSASSEPHVMRTSSGTSMKKRMAIQVVTGDQRLNEKLFQLEWLIFSIITAGIPSLFTLQWNGKPFVRNVKPVSVTDAFMIADNLNPHSRGWTSVYSLEFELWFRTDEL